MKTIFTFLVAFTFSALMLNCSLAFSQQRIFATIVGGDLYSFDLTNCTRHFIGSTGQGFGDIAFTPDGRLWGIVGGLLYQIDTATANATLIGNTGIGAVSLVDLNDSTLLAEYGEKLYGINNNNGSSYYIDTIGYGANGDLTWYDNDLYMVTPLVKIVLNNTYTAILSVTAISTTIPICEGAATASFVGDYNSIVGFNGSNLIKICQIDGSYQMLCPSLNIGGTPGAAAMRLATQDPQPTTCNIPTSVANIISQNADFEVFSNPATNQIEIKADDILSLTLYDVLGRVVFSNSEIIAPLTINTTSFSRGIYFLQARTKNGVVARKVILSEP